MVVVEHKGIEAKAMVIMIRLIMIWNKRPLTCRQTIGNDRNRLVMVEWKETFNTKIYITGENNNN